MPSGECVAQTGSSRKKHQKVPTGKGLEETGDRSATNSPHLFWQQYREEPRGVCAHFTDSLVSPESCVVKMGFTSLWIKQSKIVASSFNDVGL